MHEVVGFQVRHCSANIFGKLKLIGTADLGPPPRGQVLQQTTFCHELGYNHCRRAGCADSNQLHKIWMLQPPAIKIGPSMISGYGLPP